jgi:hypothetical protein
MARNSDPHEPLPEWALDKMIGVLEGPVNRALERVMTSRVVLLPLSLSMNLGLRVYTRLHGKQTAHLPHATHAAPPTQTHGSRR